MNGDIVAALRQLFYSDQIEWEAADAIEARDAEIERLRAEVDRLRAAGDALAAVSLGARPWITPLFAMEHGDRISRAIAAWEEARRG